MDNIESPQLETRDYMIMAIVLVFGTAARLFFLGIQSIPRFDPWRHPLLVENLRAGRGFNLK